MQAMVQEEGGNFALAPWDWRYYAEKLRKLRCDVDEATIKPYFQLPHIIEAAFYTAYRLFGLSFERRKDVPVWHPDVQVWEVRGADGSHRGLFFGDYFARASKQGGAWMTTLRDQEKLAGDIRPLVVNVMNFNKAGGEQPTLLSFDDARTLFHEFGHALHALLSDVTYPMVSGTSVLTDWVELPSQLYEHWLERPEILQRFAVHARTGQPMPDELMRRVLAARTFNQGLRRSNMSRRRWSISTSICRRTRRHSTSTRSRARRSRASACRRRSSCATGRRISGTCSRAAAMPRPITATCGRRCSTPTLLRRSRRPATSSTRRPPRACTTTSIPPAARATRGALYTAFRGRLPTPEALLKRRGSGRGV